MAGARGTPYDLTHRALTEPLRFELDAAGSATNAGLGVGPIEDLLGGLPPDGRRLADGPSA